jgi:plasmid stabilization system protein ParE
MAHEIVWSKTADKDLYEMVEYAEANWSDPAFRAFINNIFALIDLLAEFPEMGVSENPRKQLRSYLISKNCRLFYRIADEKIILLSFIDTRSNKDKPE